MKASLHFILFSMLSLLTHAQDRFLAEPTIKFGTVDRAGDLYLVLETEVVKYDSQGERVAARPHIGAAGFDTGNSARMLLYNPTQQLVYFLNPGLSLTDSLLIDTSIAIEPTLVCSHGDYGLLVFDAADGSIKLIDSRDKSVSSDRKLAIAGAFNPVYMRYYQNFLFILNKGAGIEVFSLFGKHLRTIPAAGLSTFNFFGEELYYLEAGTLQFVDLFTLEQRSVAYPNPVVTSLLLTETRQYALTDRGVEVADNSIMK